MDDQSTSKARTTFWVGDKAMTPEEYQEWIRKVGDVSYHPDANLPVEDLILLSDRPPSPWHAMFAGVLIGWSSAAMIVAIHLAVMS